MKHLRLTILILPILMLLVYGCTREELIDTSTKEGEKTTIHLRLKVPEMAVHTRTSLPEADERKIASLCIYIFDKTTGTLVSNTIHENAGAHASDKVGDMDGEISPDGKNYIDIETLSGLNREIYVIANYHSYTIENLKGVSTIDEVKQLIARSYGNPLSREFGMVMTGTLTTDIQKDKDITIPLEFLSAKITLKVINKCPDFDIEGWTTDGLPTVSYIFKRSVEGEDDPNYHDASDITSRSDYFYDFTDQNFPFEETTDNSGSGGGLEYSSTFYTYENRRGGRVERQEPPISSTSRSEYQLKAWYAPDNATRVRIWGKLKGDSPKSICINHYLGANNTNDYNVLRATHYTYTITINSLNSIDIDTNIEQQEISLDILQSADLTNIDAHYDVRLFLLKTNEIADSNVKISTEVLQAVNSDTPAEWLNLSIFPSNLHHVRKKNDAPNEDISQWQQEGDDNTYVRPQYIPNKATRTQLTAAGKSFKGSDIIGTSDNYPDDDTTLPYERAIHRMCKKITDIPTGSSLSQPINIYLYIDEYPFDASFNAKSYREAVVRITILKGNETPQYKHFIIRQYPPYRFVKTINGNEMLVAERVEEYEHYTQPTLPMGQQMLRGMQWGNYNFTNEGGLNINDGPDNTLRGVYSTVLGTDYFKTYLPQKYGSGTNEWKSDNYGLITEGNGINIPTRGTPYFNLPEYGNNNVYHAIYNTTAARYCHEKNRDINGDGQIDASETTWYLPSLQELQLFWTYHEALNLHIDYYWSSTEADTDNAYAISMLNNPAAPHLTYNGVAQQINKKTALSKKFPRVRCVRRIKLPTGTNITTPIRPIVSHRTDGTSVVDCSNLPNDMYTTESKLGTNRADVGSIQRANRQVYKKFEVQRKENTMTNYNDLHQGNGKCDATQNWRLPTQREMLLIWSVKDLLEAEPAFTKFTTTAGNADYWTMSGDLSAQYVIDFNTGLCRYDNLFDSSHLLHYRCIREIK